MIMSAIGQPASSSGMMTVRPGFSTAAVSAMKRTPQKTMMSASFTSAAFLLSP